MTDRYASAISRHAAPEFCKFVRPWLHRYRRQPDCFVSSSTPFLAWFGLEAKALATVRVKEDTGAVPRSVYRLCRLWAQRAQFRHGRLTRTARCHILADFGDTRAQGKTGCALHPRSRVPMHIAKTHTSIQVQRKQSGLPCAMVLRLTSCSPRRDRACLPPSPPRSLLLENLTPAIGASGPHDFAVRSNAVRQKRPCVHRSPHPTSVTIAIRPSWWVRDGDNTQVIWVKRK
jgi:hypothetical protein